MATVLARQVDLNGLSLDGWIVEQWQAYQPVICGTVRSRNTGHAIRIGAKSKLVAHTADTKSLNLNPLTPRRDDEIDA